MGKDRLQTPDGRYRVSRGRLHRSTNPALADGDRRALIKTLMQARMKLQSAVDSREQSVARDQLELAKVALGEAGPVWWKDGAPDESGQHPSATTYASWWWALPEEVRQSAEFDKRAVPSSE